MRTCDEQWVKQFQHILSRTWNPLLMRPHWGVVRVRRCVRTVGVSKLYVGFRFGFGSSVRLHIFSVLNLDVSHNEWNRDLTSRFGRIIVFYFIIICTSTTKERASSSNTFTLVSNTLLLNQSKLGGSVLSCIEGIMRNLASIRKWTKYRRILSCVLEWVFIVLLQLIQIWLTSIVAESTIPTSLFCPKLTLSFPGHIY
jgi:hypothetical protein